MPDKKRTATGVLGGLAGLAGLSAVAGILVTATVTPAIAVSGVAASSAIDLFEDMPSILEIEDAMQQSTFWVGDQILAQFYDQNRVPVTFEQVAPVMYDSVLSSEDPRYYQHGGVDLIGTTRALLSNASGGQTQGGSSISQQYVKNVLIQDCERNAAAEYETDADGNPVFDEAGAPIELASRSAVLQACWTEATNAEGVEGYQRKLQEMRYAIQLEKEYSKNEILLGYLNIANFGGTTYGIEAAAKRYFNVSASQLSLSQAATLAGIVQNPNTYRIDKTAGSITASDGVTYNKEADGSIDDVDPTTISALNTLVDDGTITPEQRLAAADAYSATKGRQLYVLSRLFDDGKITQEQYIAAAIEPIVPAVTDTAQGCGASAAPYFCQYVLSVVLDDEAFGDTAEARLKTLRQDGLNIYTTLDWNVQNASQNAISEYAPQMVDGMDFGSASVSIEATTGRVLGIAQNTKFSEEPDPGPGLSSIVYAGDRDHGGSIGFSAGSTFKLFTLVDWLENGRSVNEVINGNDVAIRRFPSTCGDWVNTTNWKPGNFGGGGGGTATPMHFTAQSVNSGYVAMAAQLDLCSIGKVATKMGVTDGRTGLPIETTVPNQVIGSDNVSPIAMAGAYGTVANNGVYCQPKVIDRVTDSDGAERPIPNTTCTPVISPEVAATAAYALEGVMSGGTGRQGNPRDGTSLIGKTGTHQQWQTWMVESSTRVATAVWVGNAVGTQDLFKRSHNGTTLSNLRYSIARDIQGVADEFYPGGDFPNPDGNLTRRIVRDVPNVVGQTIEQAQETLRSAGWNSQVGDPVDSDQPGNVIAAQNPAGSAPAGSIITISPSNGQGATVPSVAGSALEQAQATLNAAGFAGVTAGVCTADPNVQPGQRLASTTNPPAGTPVNRSTTIAVDYTSRTCP